MNRKRKYAWTLILVVALTSIAVSQDKNWVLPVADGGPTPSPPSVHGYLVKVANKTLVVQCESHDPGTQRAATVQFKDKTKFFTAYGGFYTPDELRPGQYVWIWYVTRDPAKAGTPPVAAVVILWSKNPADKPSKKVRWSYDTK